MSTGIAHHEALVLCGTSYEWYQCPTCGLCIFGTSNTKLAQQVHDDPYNNFFGYSITIGRKSNAAHR